MPNCKSCLWSYDDQCVSESLDEIAEDTSFGTCNCIGYLREDYMDHMIEMKSVILYFCPDDNKALYDYIVNMSYKDTLKLYEDTMAKSNLSVNLK